MASTTLKNVRVKIIKIIVIINNASKIVQKLLNNVKSNK